MAMLTIRDVMNAWKLGRVAARIQASAKPSIRLVAGRISDAACNRIGGRPNLPRSFEWPQRDGRPLEFLAQFDLRTLPEMPGSDLPRSGALFFFHEGGENPAWGYDSNDRGSAQVLYSEQPLAKSKPRPMPRALEKSRRYRGVKLGIGPVEATLPDSRDEIVQTWGLSQAELGRYDALMDNIWEQRDLGSWMGGYPDELQHWVRLQAQSVSNGLNCGDSSGYQGRKAKRLRAGATGWELLMQIDSEGRAGTMWGDGGLIYFMIRRDDLRERRFDKAWAILQCC
jgi:uncharacterized protein YwqG